MSKSQKKHIPKKPVAKKQIADKPVVKKQASVPQTFLERMDTFLQQHDKLLFGIIFAIALLVSASLYDPRISLSGDDASYIIAAQNFIRHFTFPGYQGPLYPIALSPVVGIFGISLLPLKLFSMAAMLGFFYFTFAAFRRRIPASILMPMLLLVAVNSSVLYYASQTYSEAFYMLVQSLVVLVFFRYMLDKPSLNLRTGWRSLLWLLLVVLAVTMARSAGFAVVVAVAGYFLLNKQWKNLGYFICGFLLIYGCYAVLKTIVWGGDLQFASQGSGLLNKNFYRPEQGREDLAGLIVRFWQNSVQYLSNGLFNIVGFQYKVGDNSILRTLVVFVLLLGGWLLSFKRNRALSFVLMLMLTFLAVTFVVLQVMWNQSRLIVPVFPYMLIGIFACFYYLLSIKKLRKLQFLYPVLIAVLFVVGMRHTAKVAVPEAKKLTNQYSGLPVEWVNFCKIGLWAEKNLPDTAVILSRKPTISSVYARGRAFSGIAVVPSGNADAFLQTLAADSGAYTLLPINSASQSIFPALTASYYARIHVKDSAIWAFRRTPQLDAQLAWLKARPMPVRNFEALSAKADNKFGVFYPDSLLADMQRRRLSYIITAEIGYNTVERYAYYVQEKYPTLFEFVYQEGANDKKPAKIFRVRWETIK